MSADDRRIGWFADIDPEAPAAYQWVPVVQTPGCCFPLPVWFATEDECSDWIDSDIIGLGRLPE